MSNHDQELVGGDNEQTNLLQLSHPTSSSSSPPDSDHGDNEAATYLNNYFTRAISEEYRKTIFSQCFALLLNRRTENIASLVCLLVIGIVLALISVTLSATHTMIEDADCTAALKLKEICGIMNGNGSRINLDIGMDSIENEMGFSNCSGYEGFELVIAGYVFDASSLFYANIDREKIKENRYLWNSVELACPVLCSSDNVTWSYKDCDRNNATLLIIDNVCLKFDSVFCSANMLVADTALSVFSKLKDSSVDVLINFAPFQAPVIILLLKAFMSIPSSVFKIDHMGWKLLLSLYILLPFMLSWLAIKIRIFSLLGVYNAAEEGVPFLISLGLQLVTDIIAPFFSAILRSTFHVFKQFAGWIGTQCKPPDIEDCCCQCPKCHCNCGCIEYFNVDITITDHLFPTKKGRVYKAFTVLFGTHNSEMDHQHSQKSSTNVGGWRVLVGVLLVVACLLTMTMIVVINYFFPLLSHERIMITYFFLFYTVLHHSYGFIIVINYLICLQKRRNYIVLVIFGIVRFIGVIIVIGTVLHFSLIEFYPYTW